MTDYLAGELADSGTQIESINSVYESGISGVYGYMLSRYWRYGTKNIKVEIKQQIGEGIILCGVSACKWVDYSTAGNILFGFSAEAAQIPDLIYELVGGIEHIAETSVDPNENVDWVNCSSSYCDDPGDFAAVSFGAYLYQTYGADITQTEFQQALSIDILNSFEPPPSTFNIPFSPYHGFNNYQIGEFDYR